MHTGSPPISRVITMVLFALSCIGLLLFLWLSFGGTIPFNAQGYRVQRVVPQRPGPGHPGRRADRRRVGGQGGLASRSTPRATGTMATIQLEQQVRADPPGRAARSCATKTILGETYVQLTPGHAERARRCPTAARSRAARCCPRSSSRTSSTRSIRRPGMPSRSGSRSWPRPSRATTRTSTACWATCRTFAADATDILRCSTSSTVAVRQPGPERRHRVRGARREPVRAAQPDHDRRDRRSRRPPRTTTRWPTPSTCSRRS